MKKVFVLLVKELREIVQQRLLLLGIIVPPVIFTLLPLFAFSKLGQATSTTSMMTSGSNLGLTGMSQPEIAQVVMAMSLSVIYMLLPGIITSVIAAYSIVGEKTSRTLEPLLATPLRTWELLLGKCLVALVPGIGMTWLSGCGFILIIKMFAISPRVFNTIISPGWLVLFLVWAPLLAIIANAVIILISSRVNEPRTAQQLSAWLIVPFMVVFVSQLAGFQVLNPLITLIVALLLVVLAFGAMWMATLFFQRETILTRWK